MIDKLRLWNYIALTGSQVQYDLGGNQKLADFYREVVYNMWDTFSKEEKDWLDQNALNKPYGWNDPVARQKEIIDLIIKIGEPEVVYEPLTHQLPLF